MLLLSARRRATAECERRCGACTEGSFLQPRRGERWHVASIISRIRTGSSFFPPSSSSKSANFNCKHNCFIFYTENIKCDNSSDALPHNPRCVFFFFFPVPRTLTHSVSVPSFAARALWSPCLTVASLKDCLHLASALGLNPCFFTERACPLKASCSPQYKLSGKLRK